MRFKIIMASICVCLSLNSCIQEEALNAEADILACTLPDPSVLKMAPIITNNTVIIMAKPTTDITRLVLYFTLTKGATIDPPSGTERDFSTIQTYTVTSQDRKWKKEYKILVSTANIDTKFSFEYWEIVEGARGKKWYEFYEMSSDGQKQPIWATANAGYALTGSPGLTDPLTYPTTSYEMGYINKGAKLETKSTGAFGSLLGMPLAAGNLFIGTFDASMAGKGAEEALKATLFGIPISYLHKPVSFEAWYKYTPGPIFTDENKNPIEGQTDKFDMYAILYEPQNGKKLDGSITFKEDFIVAIARVEDPTPSSEFKKLFIPFEYRKKVDYDKLTKGEYYTAVVFSSSRDGAYFKGAIGSTLIIDEAKIRLEGE